MLQVESVLKTDFSAYVTSAGYNGTTGSRGLPDDDRAVAIIRELVRGNMAGIRQTAVNANNAVSMLQTLDAAATAIGEKLAEMETLADQVVNGYYTGAEKAKTQEDVEKLAQEINSIAGGTKYNDNELFSANGQTISVPMGDGSSIHIFARDLSFNTEGLDLTSDAKGALAAMQAARENLSEYSGYLSRQAGRLEEAMAAVELDYGKVMGIESSYFDSDLAKVVASKLLDDVSILLQIQANVMPVTAARLLEYRGEYTVNV